MVETMAAAYYGGVLARAYVRVRALPRIGTPWEREPCRLWNLREMVDTIHLLELAVCLSRLERAVTSIEMALDPMPPSSQASVLTQTRPFLHEAIDGIVEVCERDQIPLSRPTRNQLERVKMLRGQHPTIGPVVNPSDYRTLADWARHFRDSLLDDLESHLFYFVAESDRWLMEASANHFGDEVAAKFTAATTDIAAAARCLALREGTACVFHLMRALEHGLHELARSVSISMASTVELENWKNIIDQIEAAIRKERKAVAATPKSHAKDQRLQRFGEIALQLGYFKDAWRNHVSHARQIYDTDQARSVWNHTQEFMQKMANAI